MRTKKTIFSQIMSLVSRYEFQKCVDRYKGDWHAKTLTCLDQFKIMSFAQFTDRSSLRDIEMTLEFCGKGLYHAGLRTVPKSTLAEANEKRNWMIYRDFAKVLIKWAKELYRDDYFRLGLNEMVYALDSTSIRICLELSPWAEFHHGEGCVKMHTLIDLRGSIPSYIVMTNGLVHDSKVMPMIPVEEHAFYLMDKGYIFFKQLYECFHLKHAYFVTRAKDNMLYNIIEEYEVDKSTGLISDQLIRLTGLKPSVQYPEPLRMVVYEDYVTNNVYRFLTNNLTIDSLTVAELYRERWSVEFYFYDKNNIMRSEWKSIIEDQNFRRMLLRSTSHNDNYFFRPLSQSLRFLLFSQDLSVSRLGVRSVYAFSNASRFALESARA